MTPVVIRMGGNLRGYYFAGSFDITSEGNWLPVIKYTKEGAFPFIGHAAARGVVRFLNEELDMNAELELL